MSSALDALLEILDIEQLDDDLFRGFSPPEDRVRVFGGQVAAQALVAAGRTVEEPRLVHSLHSYFLRPGDPKSPILFEVDRIRDGRSFTTRRVKAIQHGKAIFNLAASFQIVEPGPEHAMPMPEMPTADSLPSFTERAKPYLDELPDQLREWILRERPIELRPVEDPRFLDPSPRDPVQDVWIRTNGVLPDDPLLHACVVAYASDLTLLDTTLLPHGVEAFAGRFQIASLDHAMWFHRPFRADDWLLYHQVSTTAGGARAFARGEIFDGHGALVVSVVQEGLIRPL
ncbi:MAG: acyl-CoA thioesterase II [Acidimicrobiia bacterium]